jgi:hypothetical protein
VRKSTFDGKLLHLLVVLALAGCSREPVVARVDRTPISLHAFTTRYRDFLRTTHLPDNLKYRHLFLQSLIDEQLLLRHADDQHLLEDPATREAFRVIADQQLLNALYDRVIVPRLSISEAELRRFFTWSNISLHVRHLFARDRETITQIAEQLAAGVPWDTLAYRHFNDPVLRHNGGDLGFVSLGDLDPDFERVAYQLADGEISGPVQTEYGYSIIQVIEREYDPLPTETDFQERRGWLRQIARNHKKMPLVRAYTDSVAAALQLEFDPVGLDVLLNQVRSGDGATLETPIQAAQHPCLTVGATGELWTVARAYESLMNLAERKRRRLTNPDNLRDALTGLVVNTRLLQTARELGLDQSPEYRDRVARECDGYVVKQVLRSIYARVEPAAGDSLKTRRWQAYLAFRDSLRNITSVVIDSTLVKSFLLPENV